MTDMDLVRHKLGLLAEYYEDLKQLRGLSAATLTTDKKTRRYAERTLQMAIEACLDIGNQIIAAKGLREPSSNREVFLILIENGLLPPEKSADFQKMAQFHNLLVHDYARIEPAILARILSDSLDDFLIFLEAVSSLLAK